MKVNNVTPNNFNVPNFKSKIAIDIGGSTSEGSCKIKYLTNDYKELFSHKTTVNDAGKKTFKNAKDFVEKVADKIELAQNEGRKVIEKLGLPTAENALKSIVLFCPSYTYDDKVLYTANLRSEEKKPLRDINFKTLPSVLNARGVEVEEGVNLKVLQDAMGSGLAVTKKLHQKGMLKAGSYYTIAITGGGCGITSVRGLSDDKALIESSGSSYLTDSLGVVKISKLGASAPSVIRNFCKAFGIDEETSEEITSCGIGYIVTNPTSKIPETPQGEKLRNVLLSSGRYEEITSDYGDKWISVKDKYSEKFEHARYNAINKYAHALARLAVIKQNEGSNGLIITGPLAMALDTSCRNNYQTSLADWVLDKIEESYNTYELNKMKSKYDFQVHCSQDFAVKDNTAGASLAHEGSFIGNERFNWLEVDLNKISNVKN